MALGHGPCCVIAAPTSSASTKGRFGNDCIAFSHESATSITPADFNHDGIIDLAVPHREGGQSSVHMNDVVYFGSAPDGARRR